MTCEREAFSQAAEINCNVYHCVVFQCLFSPEVCASPLYASMISCLCHFRLCVLESIQCGSVCHYVMCQSQCSIEVFVTKLCLVSVKYASQCCCELSISFSLVRCYTQECGVDATDGGAQQHLKS